MLNHRNLMFAFASVIAVSFATPAMASLQIVSVVGGQPANGVNYVNFDALPLGATGGNAPNTANTDYIAVSFTPNAQVVSGSASGQYAAPFLSSSNGTLFGDNNNGPDTTRYLTSGSTGDTAGAAVNLEFTSGQQYLGLLWGSVDDYNTLTFHYTDNTTESITGLDVSALANGDQGEQGTYYVNINAMKPFDKVVATSSDFAFEFDNVAYSQSPIPEPATLLVWSALGCLGIAAYRRHAKRA